MRNVAKAEPASPVADWLEAHRAAEEKILQAAQDLCHLQSHVIDSRAGVRKDDPLC